MGGEIKFKWASAFLHCLAAPSEPNQSVVIHRQCMAIDFKNQRLFNVVELLGLKPEANLLPNHFIYKPAYELQTNRTTYDTVFNSDATQIIKFDFQTCRRTFAPTGSSPRPASNFYMLFSDYESTLIAPRRT